MERSVAERPKAIATIASMEIEATMIAEISVENTKIRKLNL
jgi:hypothetical protein